MTEKAPKFTNRLAEETSPYLLQHAHNPVDWYPWGPEALERAKAEEKPIFLSIGYSACHWCHVMEHESFENEHTAGLMNELFVNVKVDREERPDLDEIYMKAVMAMTGSGGWPMSVFLTPDLEPFFGGTYFPPVGLHGGPGFLDVLTSLAKAWEQDKGKVAGQAKRMTDHIRKETTADTRGEVDPSVLDRSLQMLREAFDPVWGGFGSAPKFPHAMDIRLALRHHLRTAEPFALEMATYTLDKMSSGGIYDQLGGGFHRYSTDEEWLIPHFEKMLYDNALLVPAYLEAYLVTKNESYARIARECLEWALREMTTPEGGFASAQDADTEGEEGKFFAWLPDEIDQVLGKRRGARVRDWYGVTDEGNFERGTSALWRPETADMLSQRHKMSIEDLEADMAGARSELFEARKARVAPGTDDKVLAAWNGLMISAFAMAYQVLGDEHFLAAAQRAGRYVLENMRQEDGRLFATARNGRAHINACLDDYVFMIQGCIDLYESDFDPHWLHEAKKLNAVVSERFKDPMNGGFFTTGDGHETLIARLKNPHDGALPAGNGVQALNLLRLAELLGEGTLAREAQETILSQGAIVNRYPAVFSQLLAAVDFLAAGPREVVIAGDPADASVREMLATVRGTFQPQRVVAMSGPNADADLMPILSEKDAPAGEARAFVCRNYACQAPVDSAEALREELSD